MRPHEFAELRLRKEQAHPAVLGTALEMRTSLRENSRMRTSQMPRSLFNFFSGYKQKNVSVFFVMITHFARLYKFYWP